MKRALVLLLALAACDDSGTALPIPDAGADVALVSPETLGRGEYLARHVAGCGECHTPRDAQGNLDMSRWMGGVPALFDLAPLDDDTGAISAPNLTPHASGLGRWSDAQVLRAIRDGVSGNGRPLAPLMPSYAYHAMSDDDARAVVAYLRSLRAIDATMPPRQPLPIALAAPIPPVADAAIPHTTLPKTDPSFARAENGRYLAAIACMDCHSPWRYDAPSAIDARSLFAGGRAFSSKEWAVPAPAPAVVYASNLTPHASGIAGWSADAVAHVLATGHDEDGRALCRPMPSGPFGSFGGIAADDARDIGLYLTTLPAIDSGAIPRCLRE